MLKSIDLEVAEDERLVRVTYDVGRGTGKIHRKIIAQPKHALHITDERDEQGTSTDKTPDMVVDKQVFVWSFGDG